MRRLIMAMFLLGALSCGSESEDPAGPIVPQGVDCEVGGMKCDGNQVWICSYDFESQRIEWELFRDCEDNVDSGRTACKPFDGVPVCQLPDE